MSAAASGSAICATMPHSSGGQRRSQIPAMGTYGDSSAPEYPLGGSGTRGDTATMATLTEAEGLPPDPHHPPQLPCRAGQQEVTGEAEGDKAKCHPLPEPPDPGTEGQTAQGWHLPLLGLSIHHDGDVALNEGEGEEGDGVEVLAAGGCIPRGAAEGERDTGRGHNPQNGEEEGLVVALGV